MSVSGYEQVRPSTSRYEFKQRTDDGSLRTETYIGGIGIVPSSILMTMGRIPVKRPHLLGWLLKTGVGTGADLFESHPVYIGAGALHAPLGFGIAQFVNLGVAIGKVERVAATVAGGGHVGEGLGIIHGNHKPAVVDAAFVFVGEEPEPGGCG
ncbi:MAG: hypothetical protein JWQ71_3055 [Pedosphaera sp.]|nr:hypothetical protein [Pedosphaera sp.]